MALVSHRADRAGPEPVGNIDCGTLYPALPAEYMEGACYFIAFRSQRPSFRLRQASAPQIGSRRLIFRKRNDTAHAAVHRTEKIAEFPVQAARSKDPAVAGRIEDAQLRSSRILDDDGASQAGLVDPLPQLLSRFEMDGIGRRQIQHFARKRISSLTGRPIPQRESAEPAYFNALIGHQGLADEVQDAVDRRINVGFIQMNLSFG